ncbi:MAG TPA: hypothetical protein VMW91_04310, partial [Desulfosporosinus sp.]|nr:hypothetical protein [Desulfosporosinus sp.]
MGCSPQLPVIVGSEIGTPYGEFLLFGSKAIKNWYLYRRRLLRVQELFGIEGYCNAFIEYVLHSRKDTRFFKKRTDHESKPLTSSKRVCKLPYSMFVCHPEDDLTSFQAWPDAFYDALHGFEIQNDQRHYDSYAPEVVDWLKSKIKKPWLLRNSDAHDEEVGRVCNTFTFPDGKEINEGNLIACIGKRR